MKFRSNSPDLEARGCYVFVTGATAMTIATGALIGAGTGAVIGGASSALSGGNVLKGALIGAGGGALTGGVASGIGAAGGAAAGAGTGTTASSAITPELSTAAQQAVAQGGNQMGIAGAVQAPGSATLPGFTQGTTQMGQQALSRGATEGIGKIGLEGVAGGSGLVPDATSATGIAQEQMARVASEQAAKEAGMSSFEKGLSHFTTGLKGMPDKVMNWAGENPLQAIGFVGQGINALTQNNGGGYDTTPQPQQPTSAWGISPNYQPSRPTAYKPKLGYAEGGPVNKFYAAGLQQAQQAQTQQAPPPQAQAMAPLQAQPLPQAPPQQQGIAGYARGRMVEGHGDGYARGRMVSGEGDGVSDGIEAIIDGRRPAAIASGEFIIPANAVSALGNGSSDAGAKRLDKMVNDIQRSRKKSIGRGNIARDIKAYKALPV